MSRYIDADKLIERLLKLKVVTDDMYGMGIARGIERAETAIEMQPTADVVEVVRCKDCKYFMEYSNEYRVEKANGDCYIRMVNTDCDQYCACKYDDYCSYGEREDGNGI